MTVSDLIERRSVRAILGAPYVCLCVVCRRPGLYVYESEAICFDCSNPSTNRGPVA